jgi:hypothetical protein
MPMRKTFFAMLLVLATLSGTAVLGVAGLATVTQDISGDAVEAVCDPDLNSPERLPEGIFLVAQMDKKFKCLEKCNQPRYNCEKDAKQKDKPGTKKNWEESTKCQQKYDDCLAKCE